MTKISTNLPFGGAKKCQQISRSERGASLVEILVVLAIAGVMSAMAIPQFVSARRSLRSNALSKEILMRLRETRQYAMSQRQAFTFQYDNSTKTIKIIDHNASLATLPTLFATPFPNNTGSTTFVTIPLATSGLASSEIGYGLPASAPSAAGTLTDGSTLTALVTNKVTVTFQPDGTVVDANNVPVSRALFFYNTQADISTATAISVLGAGGRVKLWKYNTGTSRYVE